jgi:hypothetical protein
MIRDDLDVHIHYYNQPVVSDDQATSLVEYLKRHGQEVFKNGSDEVQVVMECSSPADAAERTASVFTLISTWRLFWEHSDKGVFELPIYVKD